MTTLHHPETLKVVNRSLLQRAAEDEHTKHASQYLHHSNTVPVFIIMQAACSESHLLKIQLFSP